eukprot:2626654-Rhodomonas_salina.1
MVQLAYTAKSNARNRALSTNCTEKQGEGSQALCSAPLVPSPPCDTAADYGGIAAIYGGCADVYGGCAAIYGGDDGIYGGSGEGQGGKGRHVTLACLWPPPPLTTPSLHVPEIEAVLPFMEAEMAFVGARVAFRDACCHIRWHRGRLWQRCCRFGG